jgi:hypothetical protein
MFIQNDTVSLLGLFEAVIGIFFIVIGLLERSTADQNANSVIEFGVFLAITGFILFYFCRLSAFPSLAF